MINEKHLNKIRKALIDSNGLSISDMERNLRLVRCQVRTSIAYLLGSKEIEEHTFGKAKVYYLVNLK